VAVISLELRFFCSIVCDSQAENPRKGDDMEDNDGKLRCRLIWADKGL
jgi:hypothetical protein